MKYLINYKSKFNMNIKSILTMILMILTTVMHDEVDGWTTEHDKWDNDMDDTMMTRMIYGMWGNISNIIGSIMNMTHIMLDTTTHDLDDGRKTDDDRQGHDMSPILIATVMYVMSTMWWLGSSQTAEGKLWGDDRGAATGSVAGRRGLR